MRKNSPAVYECPKSKKYGMHYWRRNDDGTASCINCDLELSVEDATDTFTDYEDRHKVSDKP